MLKKLNYTTSGISENHPVKIIQFGEGNFLRGYVDWMIDILNEKLHFDAGVCIIKPTPRGSLKLFEEQDGLYHVILQGIKDNKNITETRLITSINGVINPYSDFKAFLSLAENPDIEFIFSNTTEAGIEFNADDLSILQVPNSYPGKLTAFLYRRFVHFSGSDDMGLVIIPCELIEKNGEKLKNIIYKYAEYWDLDKKFTDWLNVCVTFCNSLVDRIVPGYPAEKAEDIHKEIGFEDKLLVSAEYFHLWVIEAPDWVREKFPVQKAGLNVKFVKDLSPYRTRKVRILNGIHTTMVPVGYLYGLSTVKESIDDDIVGNYLKDGLFEEIIPTLDLSEEELTGFANDVMDRFRNPFIKHNLISIALNSISKYKVRVLPSVLKYIEIRKELPKRLLFSMAALIRFYKGDRQGEKIPLNDTEDNIAFFAKVWSTNDYRKITEQVLSNDKLWDQNLNEVEGMTDWVSVCLERIDKNGMKSALSFINQ